LTVVNSLSADLGQGLFFYRGTVLSGTLLLLANSLPDQRDQRSNSERLWGRRL